jgi:hypothetical protein
MASDKATQLPFTAHLQPPTLDALLTRLSKVLSTSTGVDSTLTLVGYSLYLLSSQLPRLELALLRMQLGHSKSGAAAIIKLAELQASSKTLATMCSDFRTFTRLWGLLGVYAMAKRNWISPPKDTVLKAVAYAQTSALGMYYIYENGYYLAGKGVLRGWTGEKIKRWAKISLNAFLAFVVLEFVRLYRVRTLTQARKGNVVEAKERAQIENEENIWKKSAAMNTIYAPLSVHWASESGLLSEGVVGALMSWVGLIKFRAAWAAAA